MLTVFWKGFTNVPSPNAWACLGNLLALLWCVYAIYLPAGVWGNSCHLDSVAFSGTHAHTIEPGYVELERDREIVRYIHNSIYKNANTCRCVPPASVLAAHCHRPQPVLHRTRSGLFFVPSHCQSCLILLPAHDEYRYKLSLVQNEVHLVSATLSAAKLAMHSRGGPPLGWLQRMTEMWRGIWAQEMKGTRD